VGGSSTAVGTIVRFTLPVFCLTGADLLIGLSDPPARSGCRRFTQAVATGIRHKGWGSVLDPIFSVNPPSRPAVATSSLYVWRLVDAKKNIKISPEGTNIFHASGKSGIGRLSLSRFFRRRKR